MIRKAVFRELITEKVNRHPARFVTGGWGKNRAVEMRSAFT